MNSLAMQNRIHEILQQKAMMGAGYGGDYGGDYGGYRRRRRRAPVRRRKKSNSLAALKRAALKRMYGYGIMDDDDMMGTGVMVGGYKRKRRPSEWSLAVGDYSRKYGVTIPEAAHALKGSGIGGSYGGYRRKRRRAPIRRRRSRRGSGYGGILIGGRREVLEPFYISKAQRLLAAKGLKDYEYNNYCDGDNYERRLRKAKSKAEIGKIARECGRDPITKQRKAYLAALRNLAPGFDPTDFDPPNRGGPGGERQRFRGLNVL